MNKMFLVIIVILAGLTRLAPHPPNFTPILSIALFAGLCFKHKLSFMIPLLIMLFSDFFIGNFDMALWIYLCLLLIVYLGKYSKSRFSYKSVLVNSFISSILFFSISNFGVWIIGYPKTISGFIDCYLMAIPFYKNTLLSTLIYSSCLYYMYEVLLKKYFVYQEE